MIKTARWFWRAARRWASGRLLRWSVALHPDTFNSFILEQATAATFMSVKSHLRQRGERFCEACTSTRGPLRRVGGVAACPEHLDQVREMEAEKQRRATLPPQQAAA